MQIGAIVQRSQEQCSSGFDDLDNLFGIIIEIEDKEFLQKYGLGIVVSGDIIEHTCNVRFVYVKVYWFRTKAVKKVLKNTLKEVLNEQRL